MISVPSAVTLHGTNGVTEFYALNCGRELNHDTHGLELRNSTYQDLTDVCSDKAAGR